MFSTPYKYQSTQFNQLIKTKLTINNTHFKLFIIVYISHTTTVSFAFAVTNISDAGTSVTNPQTLNTFSQILT